jgi:hypothetical protein
MPWIRAVQPDLLHGKEELYADSGCRVRASAWIVKPAVAYRSAAQ